MRDVPSELHSERITAEKHTPRAAGGQFGQKEMKDILFQLLTHNANIHTLEGY